VTRSAWDAVLLDRDGTLTVPVAVGEYVLAPDDLVLLPGAGDAVSRLCDAGIAVFVVTNQRAVHLGLLSPAQLDAVHDRLRLLLRRFGGELADVLVCPHGHDACDCRKPADGLLRRVFGEHPGLDPRRSAIVGDSVSDVRAGDALGLTRVLLGKPEQVPHDQGVEILAVDLAAAVDRLLDAPVPRRTNP
jgi:histidinol-phosphate phosphatase family protein